MAEQMSRWVVTIAVSSIGFDAAAPASRNEPVPGFLLANFSRPTPLLQMPGPAEKASKTRGFPLRAAGIVFAGR